SGTDVCHPPSDSPVPHCAASLSFQTVHRFGYGSSEPFGMERFSRGAHFLCASDPTAWPRAAPGEESVQAFGPGNPLLYGAALGQANWFTVWTSMAVVLAMSAVIGYGGWSVIAGTLSLGSLVAFYS